MKTSNINDQLNKEEFATGKPVSPERMREIIKKDLTMLGGLISLIYSDDALLDIIALHLKMQREKVYIPSSEEVEAQVKDNV